VFTSEVSAGGKASYRASRRKARKHNLRITTPNSPAILTSMDGFWCFEIAQVYLACQCLYQCYLLEMMARTTDATY
jgi:hypothetical protein